MLKYSFLPMVQCPLLTVLHCPAADSFSVSAECVAMTAAVSFRVYCSLCAVCVSGPAAACVSGPAADCVSLSAADFVSLPWA